MKPYVCGILWQGMLGEAMAVFEKACPPRIVGLYRGFGQQLGGNSHHIAHIAMQVGTAFDDVAGQFADVTLCQMLEGAYTVNVESDWSIIRAETITCIQLYAQWQGQVLQFLVYQRGEGLIHCAQPFLSAEDLGQ